MVDIDDADLLAAIMALRDIVQPAVDADNPIAQQQLKLVIDYLNFYRSRRLIQPQMERALLEANLAIAAELVLLASNEAVVPLRAAIEQAQRFVKSQVTDAVRTRAQITELESEIAKLVRAAADFEPQLRNAIHRKVVRGNRRLLDLQRVWNQPLSIEPDPSLLPKLDDLLQSA